MKDLLVDARLKSRFIIEVRTEPLIELFDRRGDFIKKIHPLVKKELSHWLLQGNDILFVDNLENPINDAVVNIHKFAIAFETMPSIVKFKNYLDNFIFPVYEFFKINIANRIGVRIISVLKKDSLEDFDSIKNNILNATHKPLLIDVQPIDFKLHITFENGYYIVGPVKENEQWLKGMFKNQELSQPGYGIDIDSFANNVIIKSRNDLERSISALLDIAKGNEEQIAMALGIIDVQKAA